MEDNIKKDWRDTRVNIKSAVETLDIIMQGKKKSALQSLAQRYLTFSRFAIIALFLSVPAIFRIMSQVFSMKECIWLAIGFAVIFIVSSAMDRWLYNRVKALDLTAMTVTEIARKAVLYRKRHLQFVAILLPMAIVLCSAMASKCGNMYMTAGMVTCGVVGMVLGIGQLIKFLKDYGSLTE